jgi:hypothetical protein
MNKEQLQALIAALEIFPPEQRREAVERAMLITTGVATSLDECLKSFSFDFSNTWGSPPADATWTNPTRKAV